MSPELEAFRNDLVKVRLRLVTIFNAIAITVGGSILALHTMFPNAVPDFTATLSPAHKLVALFVWSTTVQLLIHRTKKAV